LGPNEPTGGCGLFRGASAREVMHDIVPDASKALTASTAHSVHHGRAARVAPGESFPILSFHSEGRATRRTWADVSHERAPDRFPSALIHHREFLRRSSSARSERQASGRCGTGSGISRCRGGLRAGKNVTALDVNPNAALSADPRENARANGLRNRVTACARTSFQRWSPVLLFDSS